MMTPIPRVRSIRVFYYGNYKVKIRETQLENIKTQGQLEPRIKLFNLSYLIFNYRQVNEQSFLAFYNTYDLFSLYNALYKNARYYAWTDNTLAAFSVHSVLGYFTKNTTIINDAEYLWNCIKSNNLLYDDPIIIKVDDDHTYYRIPYLVRKNPHNNETSIADQVMGLYFLWKATGKEQYLDDLKKTICFKESYISKNGVNNTYFYGYYYNIIWHLLVDSNDSNCYHPPYGTPVYHVYWNGTASNKLNYWTWTSHIILLFNIAIELNILSPQDYAQVFRDFFINVLWDEAKKTIWEAWEPYRNNTHSLFGRGNTRIHVYNLAPFIFAAEYYPELRNYFYEMMNTMLNYWVNNRGMYRYHPATTTTFEQYMMTIPNALFQLDASSEIAMKRNLIAINTYLITGVLSRPVAWPNKAPYYGILHAKCVSRDWTEIDSGSPSYVSLWKTFEGYVIALYLLRMYDLTQLYFNSYTYSLVNGLKKFIDSDGYLRCSYILSGKFGAKALSPHIVALNLYYPMLFKVRWGENWYKQFRYNYRWFYFPLFIQKRILNNNEIEIVVSIHDIYIGNSSLIFLPFYASEDSKLPIFNVKKVYMDGKDCTSTAIIFSDNVVAPIGRTDLWNHHVDNLTLVYSNQREYIMDKDLDLLTDYWESLSGFNSSTIDSDGDGIFDPFEALYGDLKNPDDDLDEDKMPIKYEQFYFTSPFLSDSDGDGLTDGFEIAFALNPLDIDTDNDGIIDGEELSVQFNPRTRYTPHNMYSDRSDWYYYGIKNLTGPWNNTREVKFEKTLDYDRDGMSNYYEFYHDYDIFLPEYPSVKIRLPPGLYWFNKKCLTLNWTYENITDFEGFSVQLDYKDPIFVGYSTAYTFYNLSEGLHQIRVYMHLRHVNISHEALFGIDYTNPIIIINYPKNESKTRRNNITVSIIYYDKLSGVADCLIKINDDPWTSIYLKRNFELVNLNAGKNIIQFKVIDNAGNVNTVLIIVYVGNGEKENDWTLYQILMTEAFIILLIFLCAKIRKRISMKKK